jgi:tetratricopeptide (TPR) repeat protein
VSRLYNTLEKIRTGEKGVFSEKKAAPAAGIELTANKSRTRRIVLLSGSALLCLALLLFLTLPKHKDVRPVASPDTESAPSTTAPTSLTEQSPKLPPTPAVSVAPLPSGTDKDLYRQLNDTGIALIQENQHWRGIYSLEQARRQRPDRPEALINMAVALAELGLRAPAKRLFSEAHALAPNHPLLRKNLDLLGQADFFDDQWVASLFAGPTQFGQTPEPQ